MKPDQLLHSLKEIAEKLDIFIEEQNLRKTVDGVKIKSGLCTVRGRSRLILDKNMPIQEKNGMIASCLAQFSLEHLYVVPAVREFLNRFSASAPVGPAGQGEGADSAHEPGETRETG